MKKPTLCALWKKNTFTPASMNLDLVTVLSRTSHIERDLLKCRECGQLYFHEWYEHVRFKHGADMYDTYIPVETEKDIEELTRTKDSASLAKFIPQLHGSFTNGRGDHLRWILAKN
jgi:hypothetical protein